MKRREVISGTKETNWNSVNKVDKNRSLSGPLFLPRVFFRNTWMPPHKGKDTKTDPTLYAEGVCSEASF